MRSTRAPEHRPQAAAQRADDFPWPSLLVLGAVTFVLVTGEMLPTAVLPSLSADLGVPAASAGLLVSIWATIVVVTSFPLVRLTARWDRRRVIVGSIVVFGAASVVTGLADSFAVAVAGRVAGATVTGLLWATINAHTAAIVGERSLARAVAVVLGGATLGTVLGVPAANAAAQLSNWRVIFVGLGVASLAAAAAVVLVVVGARGADDGAASASRSAHRALRPVLVVAGLTGLALVGHFAAFTFVTTLLDVPGRGVPGGVSGLLLLYGLLSAGGLLAVGRFGDRRPELTLVVTVVLVAVALLGLLLLGRQPAVDVAVVAAWGLTTGALPPLAQTMIMRLAGPGLRATAGTIVPVVFNVGIAVGAAAGSVVVSRFGDGWLPVPAALFVLLSAAGLAFTLRGAVETSGTSFSASKAIRSGAELSSTSLRTNATIASRISPGALPAP